MLHKNRKPSPRPKKSAAEKRTHLVPIRFNDAELAALESRYGRAKLSTVLREFLLTAELPRRSRKPDPELLRAFAYIGNNLNQIARSANASEGNALDRLEILAALAKLRDQIGGPGC